MSYRLIREFGLKPRVLDRPLIVSIPNSNKTLANKEVEPFLMQVHNKSIVWEFALCHLVGIDLILEMDWLSNNHAII